MSLLVPPRRPSRELLDDPSLSDSEMRLSLADIDFVHRHWGGSRALGRHIASRLGNAGRPVSILDIGAGAASVTRRLGASLAGVTGEVRLTALDVQWRHSRYGAIALRHGRRTGWAMQLAQ